MPPLLLFFYRDLIKVLRLALPITLGLLTSRILDLTDMAMIGRVEGGVVPMAAAALGSTLLLPVFVGGFGLSIAVHVLVAQYQELGRQGEAKAVLWHNVALTAIYSFIMIGLIHAGINVFDALGQDPDVAAMAKPYALFLLWSLLPMLLKQSFKNYAEALHSPWLPLKVMVFGVLLNIFLNWIFIFGHWGSPALGLTGAGLGTLLSRWAMALLLAGIMLRSPVFALPLARISSLRLNTRLLKKMLYIGGAGAVQVLLITGLFIVVAVMMGWLGKTALAAHNIVSNLAIVVLMVPLGISSALSIVVSQSCGAGRFSEAKRVWLSALIFTLLFELLVAASLLVFRQALPQAFVISPEVAALAAQLLLITVWFQIADGICVTALGGVRGLADGQAASIMLFIVFWLFALPLAYILGFYLDWGGLGIWAALTLGFMLSAYWLIRRFLHLVNRPAERYAL